MDNHIMNKSESALILAWQGLLLSNYYVDKGDVIFGGVWGIMVMMWAITGIVRVIQQARKDMNA